MDSGDIKKPDLKDDQNLSIVFLQSYVKGRFVKLAKSMDISSVFDKQLYNISMVVLGGPVQSCHLQHVLGIHICTILSQKNKFFKRIWVIVAQVQDSTTTMEDFQITHIQI